MSKLIKKFQAEEQPKLQQDETILVSKEQGEPLVDRGWKEESVGGRGEARKVLIGGRRMKNFKGKREKIQVRRIDDLCAQNKSPVIEVGMEVKIKRKVLSEQDMFTMGMPKRQRKM